MMQNMNFFFLSICTFILPKKMSQNRNEKETELLRPEDKDEFA